MFPVQINKTIPVLFLYMTVFHYFLTVNQKFVTLWGKKQI